MTRSAFGACLAAALVVGVLFRFVGLDTRIMHHDEANQAGKFGVLLETGDYRYDRNDHHGPTLYYLTLPSAWARGQTTFAAVDASTIRTVPALFGVGLILLFGLLAERLGRTAVVAAAWMAAVSPALTYYSRFYIQESLLVFFVIAYLIAQGHFARRPRLGTAIVAGLCAGLAFSTKETFVIVAVSGLVASVLAALMTDRSATARELTEARAAASERVNVFRDTTRHAAPKRVSAIRVAAMIGAGVAMAIMVAALFYASWFRYPDGPLEAIRAFGIYFDRGVGTGPHVQSWDYYLRILAFSASGGLVWTEGLVLVLALVGLVGVFRKGIGYWPRYIALYAVFGTIGFSAVRYKTPWNLLPFYAGVVLLAGFGASVLFELAGSIARRGTGERSRRRSFFARLAQVILLMVFVAGVYHLGVQSWRANFRYGTDERNPYVYAHTTPDFIRLVQRIKDIAAIHPDGNRMFVMVVAGPYEQWPLPWYLRQMTRVGYWLRAEDVGRIAPAPVVVASQENAMGLDTSLADRYVSEYYSLRPEVLLKIYIERSLWERYIAGRAQSR